MTDINFEIEGVKFNRHEGTLTINGDWHHHAMDGWCDVVDMLNKEDCPLRPTRAWFEAICKELGYNTPKKGCEKEKLEKLKLKIDELNSNLHTALHKYAWWSKVQKLSVINLIEGELCPDDGDYGDAVVIDMSPHELIIACPKKGMLSASDLIMIESETLYKFKEMSEKFGRTYHFVR